MGAFDGLRIPYARSWPHREESCGIKRTSSSAAWREPEPAYLYPWGRKERNPFFIGPYPKENLVNNLRQYEKDESQNLRRIVEEMNSLHARMGGRDSRPERVALLRAMRILQKEIDRPLARDERTAS